jgi:DNA-binding MarR family transcriptional regulator
MLSRRLRSQRPGTEIAPAEAAVLGRVGNLGPITPGQLARLEHVQPPSMTRTLERLESKGLLTRLPDPDDRRQVLMVLSDAGREYVERTRELRTAWLVVQFEKLPPADLELIVQAVPALAVLAELP